MKKLPKIITDEDFDNLWKGIDKVKRINKTRLKKYKLAILLGAKAGLRISEIVGFKDRVPELTKDKIDIQGHTIRIESGKGRKDRIVPLPKEFNQAHLSLLPLKIDRRALQFFITNLGKKVLDKDISFHTLRHYFGSKCAERMPLHEVQMLMGHSRLDTTGVYLHANPKRAIENAREVFG